MKSIILSLFPLSVLLTGVSINSASAADLTIYTYESFNSEWGPGPVIFKSFEEQCECLKNKSKTTTAFYNLYFV